jgi:hypothetical protein
MGRDTSLPIERRDGRNVTAIRECIAAKLAALSPPTINATEV